ncbi:hypothetical protein G6F65_015800 [Rhizopus arrhizus]|nr:hypothetical protein G6F65_015800 [Rhizopus arrhizus]
MALALPTARGRRCFAAAAQRVAADCGDHGLPDALQGFPVAGDVFAAVHIHVRPVFHRADIGARGKGLLAAGNDHAADVGIRLARPPCRAELIHQLIVQRIERLGAVQRQQADAAPGLDQYKRLAH